MSLPSSWIVPVALLWPRTPGRGSPSGRVAAPASGTRTSHGGMRRRLPGVDVGAPGASPPRRGQAGRTEHHMMQVAAGRGTPIKFGALALMWGSSFLFIRVAVGGLAPAQVALGRLVVGAATLALIMVLTRRRWPR